MIGKKFKRVTVSVLSAAAVAAINYTIFHSSFVFIILAVLIAHELGHYITARINNADADLPYFIPIPIVSIGVTRIRNMKHLPSHIAKKIVAYGPITGFIAAFYLLLLSFIYTSLPTLPLLFVCASEVIFNYFGFDGTKYRQIKEQDTALCTL